MYFYVLSYIILLLFLTIEVFVKKFTKAQINLIFIFLLIALSSMAGIRYGVGRDYFNYLNIFKGIEVFSDFRYLEPGFRFLVSFLKRIGFSENSLFFFFAFISLFVLLKGIKENSEYPMFSLFVYFCVFYIGYIFNVIRQGIVMSIFIYILKDIKKRNFNKVLFASLLGITIHYSGIFIILAYFIYGFNINYVGSKMYIIMIVFCLILISTSTYWMYIFIDLMPDFISAKIIGYVYKYNYKVDFMGFLQRLMLLAPFIIFYSSLKNKKDGFEGIFRIYFSGFIFYSIFSFTGMLATRINMFYRILEIILLPYLISMKKNRYIKILLFFLIIIWATTIYVHELNNPYNYPFRTIFEV